MDKPTHEENLSLSLQTNNKHFKIAINFLIGFNDIFLFFFGTIEKNEYYFTTSTHDDVGCIYYSF